MAGSAPKASDPPDAIPVEDETEMTSIMSADQRKQLQEAAGGEPEAHERDTAKPPAPAVDPEMVAIPKAAAVPSVSAAVEEPGKAPAPEAPRTAAAPAEARPAAVWSFVAFVLLAATIAYVLRG